MNICCIMIEVGCSVHKHVLDAVDKTNVGMEVVQFARFWVRHLLGNGISPINIVAPHGC